MENIQTVSAWEENVVIPTYGIGKPEKNPIFLENRVYQGSSGVVYPHPVVEKILEEKRDKTYRGLFLENQYLKIMILPELGGRVQMAYDKIRKRHFVYYNRVIKPALVGLTGPWISGGIEFNWPQHHRPSTFDPIDFKIEEHDDGGKTVWVSEVERMFHTKGMAGFRLYPDKAYLEINVKLYNRTPFPQTFLWWANPAVKVNDDYQSVFPPDVHAVFDHGKRDVSEFPIAKGTYYKVDYSAGVDISRYKNIPVPTSYMAVKSNYDFMGGYEHDAKGGLLHIADHHVSPGKKQWTWGNGEFGYAWDRNLTDEDGPYIELMTGVFTDNQPDFSWIRPFEERTFSQYFMPYSELGVVKNATKDAMVNLDIADQKITLKLYATAEYKDAVAALTYNGETIHREKITVSPSRTFVKTLPFDTSRVPERLYFTLTSASGKILVRYRPEKSTHKAVPQPADPAQAPPDIESIEQLFLTGLHIEQYRHATYKATDYYQEALRREPSDVRNNNAMGLWNLKQGQFAKAERFFSAAIETLTKRNPNPYDGEPYFNLALSLSFQDRYEEAYDAFFKSAWTAACQDAAYLNLARIAMRQLNFEEALRLISLALSRNYNSQTARHLKAVILRKLTRDTEASDVLTSSLGLDPFNLGCLFEQSLADPKIVLSLKQIARGDVHSYIEYAFDYAHAGLYTEASALLNLYRADAAEVYPMVDYYLGYFAQRMNDTASAAAWFAKAAAAKPDYCFPNRIEDVAVLQSAAEANPADAKASYYLGNFWYANRQYAEAIACWETSAGIDDSFPTVFRNLALGYHNKKQDVRKALQALERAFALAPDDARVLMELDQLHKKLNESPERRLARLEHYPSSTSDRDDLYLERVTLYNQLGDYAKAKELLASRLFHPWEGGEGKVVGQFLLCHLELAKKAIADQQYTEAINLLDATVHYPHNLGEGKLYGAQENDINYLRGCAYEGLGNETLAREFFTQATRGLSEPVQAIYYNDQQPDKIFYQGLAWKRLGERAKAETIFARLIDFGEKHLNDTIKIDYFAVSLPDLLVFDQDLDQRNKNHCHYLMGLGCLGLNNGRIPEAEKHFREVLEHDVNHLGAILHQQMIRSPILID